MSRHFGPWWHGYFLPNDPEDTRATMKPTGDQGDDAMTCACGCGGEVNPGRKRIKGHIKGGPVSLQSVLLRLVICEPSTLETGCWEWSGHRDKNGYGRYKGLGGTCLVHKIVYEHFRGPIPAGCELDHLCRNPACANWEHLEAVSHQTNMQRSLWGLKTHCPAGHEYSEENTYRGPDGHRECIQCRREQVLAHAAREKARKEESGWVFVPHKSMKTHCPKGHEYSEANTWRDKNGYRFCRECNRIRSLKANRKPKQEAHP